MRTLPFRSTRLGLLILFLGVTGLALGRPFVQGGDKARSHPPKPADMAGSLSVGFANVDVSPSLRTGPVYMAGFGNNRKATEIHDPIMARAVVLSDGKKKIALVSVDVVGLFFDFVEGVRSKLKGFDYVLVSSTHNHEGPDTLGLWGPTRFNTGVDKNYMLRLEEGILKAVGDAAGKMTLAKAHIGNLKVPELLHDGREPIVLHDDLVVLRFESKQGKNLGVLVQWNCHPETLSSSNTKVSADYVGFTVEPLEKKFGCPVAYFTGTVGGLMTSLHVKIQDPAGKELADGTFEKTKRYGELLAEASIKALNQSEAIQLSPFEVRTRRVALPLHNPLYHLGWRMGVLDRKAYKWIDAQTEGEVVTDKAGAAKLKVAVRTEVGYLRLGQLEVAAIPGEIYPELVLGKVQDPVEPGADFPDAPIEPSIYSQLKSKHKMLIGLANDEVGYIIPKRQWDEKAPYCYKRKTSQYGEINSVGPDAAPIFCEAFRSLVAEKK